MANITIRETVELMQDTLTLIQVVNGYLTDVGSKVVSNQGRVIQSDEVFEDTVNLIDEGCSWESSNVALIRTHTLVCQFYLVPTTGTLNSKIYDGMEDIEKMLVSIKRTGIASSKNAAVRFSKTKVIPWAHSENRDIALLELSMQFTYNLIT